jgi:hypothetical protein
MTTAKMAQEYALRRHRELEAFRMVRVAPHLQCAPLKPEHTVTLMFPCQRNFCFV